MPGRETQLKSSTVHDSVLHAVDEYLPILLEVICRDCTTFTKNSKETKLINEPVYIFTRVNKECKVF